MPDLAVERERMVLDQIAGRGILDAALLDAFRTVPREAFVRSEHRHQAYGDYPLPIEAGQTISQPYIVALMIEAAGVKRGGHVLEVGAGSGYAAAILAQIAGAVIAVERHPELADLAAARMLRLGYDNVRIIRTDGTRGWPEGAPYDAILVAAAGPKVPQALINQLAAGARLVMPVDRAGGDQLLVRVTKGQDGSLRREELGAVRFVPLVGEDGHG
jgi:protein-L-isoaspartate(D-aspartate) O-methyltransferase